MFANRVHCDRAYLSERVERFLRRRGRWAHLGSTATAGGGRRPALTVSRQCGAGLGRIERPLLEYLDELRPDTSGEWVLFDQSLLGTLLGRGPVRQVLPPFNPGAAKIPVSPLLGENLARPVSEWNLFNHSANAIRMLCHQGHAIVVGRAGNQVTADLPGTFHVRLVSAESNRVSFLKSSRRIGENEAAEVVAETDKARSKFVKRHAGAEIDDPLGYHLVLNTDHLSGELAARIIADSLHEWIDRSEEEIGERQENVVEAIF